MHAWNNPTDPHGPPRDSDIPDGPDPESPDVPDDRQPVDRRPIERDPDAQRAPGAGEGEPGSSPPMRA